nr:MAG TPA: hypothetical protein [Caudoviricetes sp.]
MRSLRPRRRINLTDMHKTRSPTRPRVSLA